MLLDGPYGKANLGDNAIAWCIAEFLVQQNIDVVISGMDPQYLEETMQLPSVQYLDLKKRDISVIGRIEEFDAVIVGGGQQLHEYKIPNPFIGHLARVCLMARASTAKKVPLIAWSVGMDWPLSWLARMMVKRYLAKPNVTMIFRDQKSLSRAAGLVAPSRANFSRSRDPVFMLARQIRARNLEPSVQTGEASVSSAKADTRPIVIFAVSVLSQPEGANGQLVRLAKEAADAGFRVVGWHSDIRPDYDQRVRNLADWHSVPGFSWLPADPIDTPDVSNLIQSASMVIATRMHPAIIATSFHTQCFGIATNEKMSTMFDEMSLPYSTVGDLGNYTFGQISNFDWKESFELADQFSNEVYRDGMKIVEAIKDSHSQGRNERTGL